MGSIRWFIGLPAAAGVTAVLFLLMYGLIAQDMRIDDPRPAESISILAKIIESKPTPERAERRPEPKETPPPPRTVWEREAGNVSPVVAPLPERGTPTEIELVTISQPIIRFAPAYPEACRTRGAEGVVLVQFDITERGEVTNARVVSSDNRCLDRAAVRAVLGWKYAPTARRGVTERFVFTLT